MRDALRDLVRGLDAAGPYRHPTAAERSGALAALEALVAGDRADARERFAAIGMTLQVATEDARSFVVVAAAHRTQRSWGLLALDLAAGAPHLLVGVPHPVADVGTEVLGLMLLRTVPGAALLVAGAHRRAAGTRADVAHQPGSLFHVLTVDLADRGAAQLQLHGFQDATLPGTDVVVSAGAGDPEPRTEQLADRLVDRGFGVCRAWQGAGGPLDGRTNAQGIAAATRGLPFVHLEINRRTRSDPDRRAALLDVLADAYGGRLI